MNVQITFTIVSNASLLPGATFVAELSISHVSGPALRAPFSVFFSSMRVPIPMNNSNEDSSVENAMWELEPRRNIPETRLRMLARHVNGDLCAITPCDSFELFAGESCFVRYPCSFAHISKSDAPSGLYIAWPDGRILPINELSISPIDPKLLKRGSRDNLPGVTPDSRFWKNEESKPQRTMDVCPVTPKPRFWKFLDGSGFKITPDTVIFHSDGLDTEAGYLAKVLANLLGRKPGLQTTAAQLGSTMPSAPSIQLFLSQSREFPEEGYALRSTNHGISIQASGPVGVFRGLTSLLHLIPIPNAQYGFAQIDVRAIEISDSPRFLYRGQHIDVSRHFHPLPTLRRTIDLLAMYKINVLHLHLTDDEGWRLEIPGLPELTEFGAQRSHSGLTENPSTLPPAFGSGPFSETSGSGFLKRGEFISLLQYAAARHIRILPEFEIPGHARAAIYAMRVRRSRILTRGGSLAEAEEFLLAHDEDASEYSSAQGYRDNVTCIALPSSLRFIGHVLKEVKGMYSEAGLPLDMIHLGGDEVARGAWEKDPVVQRTLRDRGIDLRSLLDEFWGEVVRIANALGISRVGGWEELVVSDSRGSDGRTRRSVNPALLQHKPVAYVWNTIFGTGVEDLGYRIANSGFPVVLSCAPFAYFDFAYEREWEERGLYWAGFIDLRTAWEWDPMDLFAIRPEVDLYGRKMRDAELVQLNEDGKRNVWGVQGQLWSELIDGRERLEGMLAPRVLALAERGWTCDSLGNWTTEQRAEGWTEFAERVGRREMPRLDAFEAFRVDGDGLGGWEYRVPVPGAVLEASQLYANVDLPFPIRYAFSRDPERNDPVLVPPLRIPGNVEKVHLACFTSTGRRGRVLVVEKSGVDPMDVDRKSEDREGALGGTARM